MAFVKNDSGIVDGGAATGSTIVIVLANTAAAGSTIVGIASWDNSSSATISSVSDDKGNTYNLETKLLDTTDNQNSQCFSLSNINNGPKTITVNLSLGVGGRSGLIEAWTGAFAASDARSSGGRGGQYQGSIGTGANAVTSGSFTPADSGCLIWGATADTSATGATDTAGTGFTLGTHNSATSGTTASLTSESLTQSVAAGIAATFTQSATSQRIASMIAFKPAPAAFTPYNSSPYGIIRSWDAPAPAPIVAAKRTPPSGPAPQNPPFMGGVPRAAQAVALCWAALTVVNAVAPITARNLTPTSAAAAPLFNRTSYETYRLWDAPAPAPITAINLKPPISGPTPQNPPLIGVRIPVEIQIGWIPPPPAPILADNLNPPIAGPIADNPPIVGSVIAAPIMVAWLPPAPAPIVVDNISPPINGPAVNNPPLAGPTSVPYAVLASWLPQAVAPIKGPVLLPVVASILIPFVRQSVDILSAWLPPAPAAIIGAKLTPPSGSSGGGGGGSGTVVTIDATATASVHATAATTISLTNLTIGTGNALLVFAHFGYSNHTGFSAVWDAGGTNQALSFIETIDNGAGAPALAIMGLLNPTPGNKTFTMSFGSAADDMVLYAVSLNNVNTRAGMSGAFAAAAIASATSNSAAISLPAILGGIQFASATGLTGAGTPTGWSGGPTSLYVDSATGTWGAGASQSATAAHTFTMPISASELWAIGGVVANPASALPTGTIIINSSNSIASGLTAAIPCLGNGTLTDLVSARTASPVGCSTDTSGGFGGGLAVPGNSTTAKADFGVWQPIPQGDSTYLAFCNPPPSSTVQGVPVGQCDSAAAGFVCLETSSKYTTATLQNATAAAWFSGSTQGADDLARAVSGGTMHVGVIDGYYHAFAGRVASGAATIWCDGANTTLEQAAVSGTYVNVSQHFAIGNLGNFTTSAFSANCTVVLVLVWNRALSDAEMASITANPFQVLTTPFSPSGAIPDAIRNSWLPVAPTIVLPRQLTPPSAPQNPPGLGARVPNEVQSAWWSQPLTVVKLAVNPPPDSPAFQPYVRQNVDIQNAWLPAAPAPITGIKLNPPISGPPPQNPPVRGARVPVEVHNAWLPPVLLPVVGFTGRITSGLVVQYTPVGATIPAAVSIAWQIGPPQPQMAGAFFTSSGPPSSLFTGSTIPTPTQAWWNITASLPQAKSFFIPPVASFPFVGTKVSREILGSWDTASQPIVTRPLIKISGPVPSAPPLGGGALIRQSILVCWTPFIPAPIYVRFTPPPPPAPPFIASLRVANTVAGIRSSDASESDRAATTGSSIRSADTESGT